MQTDYKQRDKDTIQQQRKEADWLHAVTAALWERYPDSSWGDIVRMLPEPERTTASAILDAQIVPLEALPFEREHRQPWHGYVEEAIRVLIGRGEFDMNDILAEAGIGKDERPAAKAYAASIMAILETYPTVANVPLPFVMSQQSNKLQ